MIDQIILSCNEDETYSSFWPIVAKAYKKLLPDVEVHLALVTNKEPHGTFVEEFTKYGKVTIFSPITDVPTYGQAKMARFILASQQREDVCYIDDIDLIPLSKKFITDAVERRPKNVLLAVGEECNGWVSTYPVSQMTAEGNLWQEFINPYELEYNDLIRSWTGYFFDEKEKIDIDMDMDKDRYFSDERLIRRLLRENPVPILSIRRGYENYLDSTIDRHTYDKANDEWVFDREKLKNHGYVNVHGLRPFSKFEHHYKPILDYINTL